MDQYLEEFLSKNDSLSLDNIEGNFLLSNPWNDKSIMLGFNTEDDFSILKDIYLPEELIAIQHGDNKIEFIYGPLEKSNKEVARSFIFNYIGKEYVCYFGKCSDQIEFLARAFFEADIDSRSNHRNLMFLKDFFEGDSIFDEIYDEPIAISFFIEGDFSLPDFNYSRFSKHLNFYLKFFDRKSSVIHLVKKSTSEELELGVEQELIDAFPQIINSQQIDETLLDIFGVAEETNSP
ncbi:MAG: hypothetical protein ABJ387_07665 [Balneola sp.]